MKTKFKILAGFLMLVLSGSVSAATINVPGDYTTIQEAIDSANNGDTIEVESGTYYENIIMKGGVKLMGSGANSTIIDGGGSGHVIVAANKCTISGFTVTNSGMISPSCGIYCNKVSPIIKNNIISANGARGIGCWYSSPNISNNLIINNGWNGIWVYDYSSPIITNNIIDRNNDGIYCHYKSTPIIKNNIIINNYRYGIESSSESSPIISYNNVWSNNIDYFGCSPGTGDISADPMFIDPAGGDYHLGAISPCIDTGNNTGILSTDFDGNPRSMDGDYNGIPIVDIGAFEFVPMIERADLIIINLTYIPQYPIIDENVTINGFIKNLGNIDNLTLDDVNISLFIDNVYENSKIINLTNKTGINVTLNWTAVYGEHNVTVVVDPNNEIDERYDNNNGLSIEIKVIYVNCFCSTCDECEAKLNSDLCSVVTLTADIINHSETCINNPANFTNKSFDCQKHIIEGTKSYYGIYLDNKTNNTIKNCTITGFNLGIYLNNSNNNSLYVNNVCNNTIDIYNNGVGNTGAYDRCETTYNFTCNFNCSKICYGEGESGAVAPNQLSCCDGLSAVASCYDENCTPCVSAFRCINCGDGICNDETGENQCNCPEDCIVECACNSCDECEARLNDPSCPIVILTTDISNQSETCIYGPANFNNKIFDCRGHLIAGKNVPFTWGILLYRNDNNIIRNCIITGFYRGIYLTSNADYNYIKNNTLYSNVDYGIHLDGSDNNILAGNTAYSSNVDGIYLGTSSDNNILINNTAHNNRDGILLSNAQNNLLINNTIYNSARFGINLEASSNSNLTYNTVIDNQYGLRLQHQSHNNNITSNIFCSNTKDIIDEDSNFGYNNTCSKSDEWNDAGTTGCTSICKPTCDVYCSNCDDCKTKLNWTNVTIVCLDSHITDHFETCIDDPSNFNNKVFDCQGHTIDGVRISQGCGIYLNEKSGNTIKNCVITDFYNNGIWLVNSSDNNLTNNTVNSNKECGIYLSSSSNNNNIINNTGNSNNLDGIYLSSSSDNTITNNKVSSNKWNGIYLSSSSNNIITSNTVDSNDKYGIRTYSSSNNNNITGNAVNSNNYGIHLESSSNNNIINNNADSNNYNGIVLFMSNNNNLTNNTANSHATTGIYLQSSSNSNVINNTANSNKWGIHMHNSDFNKVINNEVQESSDMGIRVSLSDTNTFSNNKILDSSSYGVYFYSDANSNTMHYNIICSYSGTDIYDGGSGFSNSGDNNTCDTPNNWNDDGAIGCSLTCQQYLRDLNNDGIITKDWNDLMIAYKCFLGIKNCDKIKYQNWNLIKQEY